MCQQSIVQFHVGNHVSTDKDEIGVDDVQVVNRAKSVAGAYTFRRYDSLDDEIGESCPS